MVVSLPLRTQLTASKPSIFVRNRRTKMLANAMCDFISDKEPSKDLERRATEIDFRTRVFLDPSGELCQRFCLIVKEIFKSHFPGVTDEDLHIALEDPAEIVNPNKPPERSGVHVLEQFDTERVRKFADASRIPGEPDCSTKSSNMHTDSGGGGGTVWSVLLYASDCTMASFPASLAMPVTDLFAELIQAEKGVITNCTLNQIAYGIIVEESTLILYNMIVVKLYYFILKLYYFIYSFMIHQTRSCWEAYRGHRDCGGTVSGGSTGKNWNGCLFPVGYSYSRINIREKVSAYYIFSCNDSIIAYVFYLNSDCSRTICFGALYVKPELKEETKRWWPDLSESERSERSDLIWSALMGDKVACESVRGWFNLALFSTEYPVTVGRCKSLLQEIQIVSVF